MQSSSETEPGTKKCPFCAETIRAEAIKCRYCAEFLDPRIPWANARVAVNLQPDDVTAPNGQTESEPNEADDDDDILYWDRPSIWAIAKTLAVCAIILLTASVLIFYPTRSLFDESTQLSDENIAALCGWIEGIGMAAAGIVLAYALIRIGMLKSICYEVTPDRIEWTRGMLGRKMDNIDMFRVVDLKLHRTVLDRILGIGTVSLITKDESDPEFDFYKVRNPKELYDIIKKESLDSDRKQNVFHIE